MQRKYTKRGSHTNIKTPKTMDDRTILPSTTTRLSTIFFLMSLLPLNVKPMKSRQTIKTNTLKRKKREQKSIKLKATYIHLSSSNPNVIREERKRERPFMILNRL